MPRGWSGLTFDRAYKPHICRDRATRLTIAALARATIAPYT
jgi:hypothetical protein